MYDLDLDDDFGELYADVQLPSFNSFTLPYNFPQQPDKINTINTTTNYNDNNINNYSDDQNSARDGWRDKTLVNRDAVGDKNEVAVENGNEFESDDGDDDFDVVVNDEDFEAKNRGVEGRKGAMEVKEEVQVEVGVAEANAGGEECGSGSVQGGNVGGNDGISQYKYMRQYGSISMDNQGATTLRRTDEDNIGYFQHRRSNMGRFARTFGGFAEQGNRFWLPWYRTILDVDIDLLEQKPWTYPGADMTDYFNFGFDEKSWKSYCESLDKCRQQMLSPTRNQKNGSSISDPIGQAIYVEDNNTERQPSMNVKRPRDFDSDVVIQLTVQDAEDPCGSINEPQDELEAKFTMSEKGSKCTNFDKETQGSGNSKAYERGKTSVEENGESQNSPSNLLRSNESATVSIHILEETSTQGIGHNSESEIQHSGREDGLSGGNPSSIETLDTFVRDADSDGKSSETNPCVAGIDKLSDVHVPSSTTSSYSGIHSEASEHDDPCDLRRTGRPRRSSPDSVMERNRGANDGCYRLKVHKRDDIERKQSCKYSSRVISSIKEDRKRGARNLLRYSEQRRHYGGDDDYHGAEHMCGKRLHCSSRWHAPDFVNKGRWHCRQKGSLLDYNAGRSFEKEFPTEHMRELGRQDHWGSRDELDSYTQRDWDCDQFNSERNRKIWGGRVGREWIRERASVFQDGNPIFRNKSNIISRSSSIEMSGRSKQREYDDINLTKRRKHFPRSEYSFKYSNCRVPDRYGLSLMDGRKRTYIDSDTEPERHFRHTGSEAGTSGRGDGKFDDTSRRGNELVDDTWHTREDHQYCCRQAFPSIDYQDESTVYAERIHHPSLSRKDADDHETSNRYERHNFYISAYKFSDGKQFCYNRGAHDRKDSVRLLHEVDYVEERIHVFQSKGVNLAEDALFGGNFNDDLCKEDVHDSVTGAQRHNLHGSNHEILPSRMNTQKQFVKGRRGVVSSSGGTLCDRSLIPTRVNHGPPGLWCRNSEELRLLVNENKSTGCVSKATNLSNEVKEFAGGRFMKHLNGKQDFSVSRVKLSTVNQDDASDLEEGQIRTEEPSAENIKAKICDSGDLNTKFILKKSLSHSQMLNRNVSSVYDENRIRETMAKMEKRRERFKEPVSENTDADSGPKPQDKLIETAEPKGQRPARKRQWA